MPPAKQAGFTIIEVVLVIILLTIFAAIVIPRLLDLTTQAQTALETHMLGTIADATAGNYMACRLPAGKGRAITRCSSITTAVLANLVPGLQTTGTNPWRIDTATNPNIAAGKIGLCKLRTPFHTTTATALNVKIMGTHTPCK